MESVSLVLLESPDYIKERLAKSELFNWIKDSSSGTHEKNAIYIVKSWLKKHNYTPNEEERKVIRNGYLTVASFTALGLGFPSLVLFAPTMRHMIYSTTFKKTCFALFCCGIGYVNYNSAHQSWMYNLLQLHKSPYAYCAFQVLCVPEYKRFRNKWQSAYNLSAVAHRYADFDLYQELRHPISSELNLIENAESQKL